MIHLWTDGCCLDNPGGAGGWAFVVEECGEICKEVNGGCAQSTNNIMEMVAVIEALKFMRDHMPNRGVFEIRCDSKYVVEGINSWMGGWKLNGWRRGKSGEVKNLPLWQELDRLVEPQQMQCRWIKGHQGARFNELAHTLAGNAAALEGDDLEVYDPAEQPLPS